jgi:hypothetical protein
MKLMNFILITIVVEVYSNQLSQGKSLSASEKLESKSRNVTDVRASESQHLTRLVKGCLQQKYITACS